MKHYAILGAIASAALIPAAAGAQTPAPSPSTAAPATGAAVTTGATVYDTSGGVVGTVASTDTSNAVIDTGTVKAAIPLTSLGKGAKGPVLAMTKAQLDAAAGAQAAQAGAAFKSKLVPGATVYGTGGATLGTIKAVDAANVTVTTPQGDAKLPINGFGPGPQGVTLGMTAAQLSAAMGAAAPAAAATPAATDASGTAMAPTADGTAAATPAAADPATMPAPDATPAAKPAKGKKPKK